MGVHRHEPCSEKLMEHEYPKWTICETFREIYRRTDDPEVKLLCRIGVSMGKAMVDKLNKYKRNWDDEFWDSKEVGYKG